MIFYHFLTYALYLERLSALAIDASAFPLEMHKNNAHKSNPPRYKPPATSYWAHSVYCYNKSSTKLLPIVSIDTGTFLHSYLNMLPREFKDIFESDQNKKNPPNLFRAFVSDKHITKGSIKQDLIGKLSHRKTGFWRPFRQLMNFQARIVFKHYPRETQIMMFVYDRRLEVLKQRLSKLSHMLQEHVRQR